MFFEALGQEFLDNIKRITFTERQRRAETKMNQLIRIRDLVVFSSSGSGCGEASVHSNKYTPLYSSAIRLRAHIAFLFDLVSGDHRINYCTRREHGGYLLKRGKENHITRLSTAEFFFTQMNH